MDTRSHDSREVASAHRQRWGRLVWRRIGAMALVTFRQGVRLRLWILAPLALLIAVVTDVSSPRFDPVFDAIPAAVGTNMFVMTVLMAVLGIFFATYPTPAEMDSKVALTLMTKPVSRWEVVAGRVLGLSALLAVMLAVVGGGAYAYVRLRAWDVQALAGRRLEEARPRTRHPADLNALEAVVRKGPLTTYRYCEADAGPDFDVRFAGRPPAPPDAVWVLGQTGMRLRWSLADTPVREWVASAPGRVQITLVPWRSPRAGDEPLEVRIRLVVHRPDPGRGGRRRRRDQEVQQVQVAVPEDGHVEVPLLGPTQEPTAGTFIVPEEGDLYLEVLAVHPEHVVGAIAGAVRIVGAAGQTRTIADRPERLPSERSGRRMLVGRPETPRPMAIFRFDDVPADRLESGDTPVEIAFTLDAYSPPTIQPTAEAAFLRPDTGQKRSFRFTPEGHHPTLLYLDREFWHGGPLEVRLQCLTPDDYMGLAPESVRLRLGGGPFVLHLAKGGFQVLLFGTVLVAAAVFVSTRLSWYVSILAMVTMFAVGTVGRIFLSYGFIGALASRVAKPLQQAPTGQWLIEHVQLQGLLPGEGFNMGEAIPWWDLAASAGLVAVVAGLFVAAGAYLLKTREVAA